MGSRYYPVEGTDKEYGSVTTITGALDKSDGLIPWAVNCAVDYIIQKGVEGKGHDVGHVIWDVLQDARTKWREVRDEAGDTGTLVHDELEKYLRFRKSGKVYVPKKPKDVKTKVWEMVIPLYEAAIAKMDEVYGGYEVVDVECRVYNHDEWYAGRFDVLIRAHGKLVLIDFKTGKYWYPEWGMQLAAYAEAWEKGNVTAIGNSGLYTLGDSIDSIEVIRLDKETLKAYRKDYSEARGSFLRAFLGLRDAWYILKAKKAVRERFLEEHNGA